VCVFVFVCVCVLVWFQCALCVCVCCDVPNILYELRIALLSTPHSTRHTLLINQRRTQTHINTSTKQAHTHSHTLTNTQAHTNTKAYSSLILLSAFLRHCTDLLIGLHRCVCVYVYVCVCGI